MRWNPIVRSAAVIGCSALVGCTSTTDPDSLYHDDGGAAFDASVDPAGSTFVLQRVVQTGPPDYEPIILELIGSNLEVDAAEETVSLDVAVRNASSVFLYPPGLVWVGRFVPETVHVLNPDVVMDSIATDVRPMRVAFDYSRLLGDDDVLSPEETTGKKTWILRDPGLSPFSFGAEAMFGAFPGRAHISGVIFFDSDRDGFRDPDEEPLAGGHVVMTAPDGERVSTHSDLEGRYAFHVGTTGLFALRFSAPPFGSPVECYTTPNPLEVVLLPGPEGGPLSFEDADFGYLPEPCDPWTPPVVMTDLDPHEIHPQDFYHYLGGTLDGDRLTLGVGFSGCSPDHPFTLYISGSFMESLPVQTWALLSHDDRGEPCDAYFEREIHFDLAPLREAYVDSYGAPGLVRIRFRDHQGEEHEFLFGP